MDEPLVFRLYRQMHCPGSYVRKRKPAESILSGKLGLKNEIFPGEPWTPPKGAVEKTTNL